MMPLTTSGTYTHFVDIANGCDTNVTLVLTVSPLIQNNINASICEGETYNFYGTILNSSGTYTHLVNLTNGCDTNADVELLHRTLKSVMTPNPICIRDEALAAEALKIFNERNIDDLIVVNAKRPSIGSSPSTRPGSS